MLYSIFSTLSPSIFPRFISFEIHTHTHTLFSYFLFQILSFDLSSSKFLKFLSYFLPPPTFLSSFSIYPHYYPTKLYINTSLWESVERAVLH